MIQPHVIRGAGGAKEAGLPFERLVFFSDAVFAIAITLLVLELRLPEGSGGHVDLVALAPKLFGFSLSFFVIGVYWLNHHRLFADLWADDAAVRVVNLVFLAAIVFLPFPTSIIAEYRPTPSAVCLYAGAVAAVGFLMTVLVVVARRPALLQAGDHFARTVHLTVYALGAPVIFAITALVALAQPVLAMRLWWLVAPGAYLAHRLGRWLATLILRREQALAQT